MTWFDARHVSLLVQSEIKKSKVHNVFTALKGSQF